MPPLLALSSTSWTVVEGSGACSSEEQEVRGNIHAGLTREGSLDKIRLKLGHKKRFINDLLRHDLCTIKHVQFECTVS